MSSYLQSPYVLAYNARILASPNARFVLAVVVIVSLLITTDTVPNLRPKNKWIIALNTTPARLVMLALCFYYLKTQPTLSFAMAGFLLICIHWYNQVKTADSFVALAYGGQQLVNQSCTNVTTQDLLDLFSGDVYSLQRTARLCGLPVGVDILDNSNAPLIGTLFMQNNIAISPSCSPAGADPSLRKANSKITMPVVAIPSGAQVTTAATNVVAGNTNMANGMSGVSVLAEVVGTETVHLHSL